MKDKKYILIVEDDETSRFLLENFLDEYNKELIYATDGEISISLTEKYNDEICLVLMDLELPKIDGYYATKKIKEINPDIPVIIQSAHALSEERDKAIKSGCDEFISKPLIKNDLVQLINKYLCSKD